MTECDVWFKLTRTASALRGAVVAGEAAMIVKRQPALALLGGSAGFGFRVERRGGEPILGNCSYFG
jgi:hypothetical protein